VSDKAYITPKLLKWARETAKISLENAASKVPCAAEKLGEWESDDCQNYPTTKQAEKLAKLYRRPLAAFYLPDIPTDFDVLKDLRSDGKGEYSTALIFMMREIQQKQEWVRDLYAENGETELDFVGRFSIKNAAAKVAADIRQTLAISTDEANGRSLKYWIEKAEAKRIFICLSSNFHNRLKLDSDEVKGFAIADKYAPFIFLNSEDWDNAQLFTLVHELAHIWINATGVSNEAEINFRDNSKINPVERFCNEVAANALLPDAELKASFSSDNVSFGNITAISKKFGVSNLTLLIRAHGLSLITPTQFNNFKKESDKQYKAFVALQAAKPKSEGGPNYYIMQLRRNSKTFAHIVFDFYKGGQISGLEASHLLNIKINNFPKFERYVYK
jgi:Zn-dependent peptidase ImmA (M78 family)